MKILTFVGENRRFLAFGLACTVAGNFGQTFFIALFGDQIRAAFSLNNTDFGAVYSIATLSGAVVILWVGKWIDHVDLRIFAAGVFVGLAAAAALVAGAQNLYILGLGLMGLRLFGQGLLRHTAMVSQARYFERERGRAMSLVGLGFPLGEAVFPSILIGALAIMNWREVWGTIALYILVFHLPLALWLLKGHGARHRDLEARLAHDGDTRPTLKRRAIATDWRFVTIMPAAVMAPFIMTGLFFHQLALAAAKGWSITWLAAGFPAFAAGIVISSLGTGWMVDRYGAKSALRVFVWPLAAALLVVAFSNNPASVLLYLALGGLTAGASAVIVSATWAEIFGVKSLGAVRALGSALAVFSTAVAPVWAGWLLDRGWRVESIALGAAAIVAVSGLLVLPGAATLGQRPSERHAKKP